MNFIFQIFILITTISFINSNSEKRNLVSCKGGLYLKNKKCVSCKAGTYSPKGKNKCYLCKAGTYSLKGATSCKKCKEGTSSSTGSSKCFTCLPGTYSKAGASCKKCSPGTFSSKGSSKCNICPAGTYSLIGSKECIDCLAGTYSSKGASKCAKCRAGTYSTNGSYKCYECEAGTYSSKGASSCTLCPPGTYSFRKSSKCTYCKAGFYSNRGSRICSSCSPGYFSKIGSAKCEPCPIGSYSSEYNSTSCIVCPKGTYTDKLGSTECKPQYSNTTQKDVDALKKAMKGSECDKGPIIEICINRTHAQRLQIAKKYKESYGKDLIDELKSELSGDFEDVVVPLFTDPIEYDADELYKANYFRNADTLIEIIVSRPPNVLEEVKKKYYKKYGGDLEYDILCNIHGLSKPLFICLLQEVRSNNTKPNETECAAIADELYQAGETKLGTDYEIFNKYFCTLSPQELVAVFNAYTKKTGHSLIKAIEEEWLLESEKTLKTIWYFNSSPSKYFATRVHDAVDGLGTDDNLLIRVLVTRSEIDMPQIKEEYKKLYGSDMYDDVDDDTSGDYRKVLLGLIG